MSRTFALEAADKQYPSFGIERLPAVAGACDQRRIDHQCWASWVRRSPNFRRLGIHAACRFTWSVGEHSGCFVVRYSL